MEAARLRDTLDRLEVHWREQNAPIARHLAPGISEDEIDLLEQLGGVVLPDVVRELYRWHNGATANGADANSQDTAFGATVWQFLSLGEMTDWVLREWRQDNLRWAEEFPEYAPEGPWPRSWIPIFRGNACAIVVESFGRRDASRRAALGDYRESDPTRALTHFCLLSLLQTWLMWFDLGAVRFDVAADEWFMDTERYAVATYRSAFW